MGQIEVEYLGNTMGQLLLQLKKKMKLLTIIRKKDTSLANAMITVFTATIFTHITTTVNVLTFTGAFYPSVVFAF